MYPNPAYDQIYIVLPEESTSASFTLYNLQGQKSQEN
ncbi:MAG: T9SS type A sorting domain-containing protein [Bacteroidales bacterium]|nr:T9SS type A sorting domain-containing protein [Bacteroidales bacterium]